MIAIDLSKQQVLDADPRGSNTTMFFIIEEAKQNCFWILTSNCESFVNKIS